MQVLRVLMLLVTVAVVYLLFVHSQAKVDNTALDPANPTTATTAHGQYKEAMDRAHAAAKAMQDERKEADAN